MEQPYSLYQQVRDDYAQLFPSSRAILALVYLYEQFGNINAAGQAFTEDDLNDALRRVAADEPTLPATSLLPEVAVSRAASSHWRYLPQLQQYLLERDRDTRTYRFTAFGLALCQSLQLVFTEKVNPAAVAQTFATLSRELKNGDLLPWLQSTLPHLRGIIQQQVEILAENIRIELRKLRRRTDQNDEEFQLLAKRVSQALTELSQQSADLRAAFGQAASLENELERQWLDYSTPDAATAAELQIGVGQARDFLQHTHNRLMSLDRRLSLVQPRVRDLFGNLRKLHFDRNSERLLDALLHSDLAPGTWPAGIGPKSPGPARLSYCLMHGRTERALPPQPVPARVRLPQPQAQAEFSRLAQAQWNVQQQVSYWLRELIIGVEAQDSFPFAVLARRVVEAEGPHAYTILARLLAQLRRQVAPRRGWTLHINPAQEEYLTTPTYLLTLWNLHISPKPLKN